GKQMTQDEWHAGWVRCIGLYLNGRTLDDVNGVGEPIIDESFLILLNPHHEPVRFTLPLIHPDTHWELCMDTRSSAEPKPNQKPRKYHILLDRSLALFREVSTEPSKPGNGNPSGG